MARAARYSERSNCTASLEAPKETRIKGSAGAINVIPTMELEIVKAINHIGGGVGLDMVRGGLYEASSIRRLRREALPNDPFEQC